MCPVFHPSLLSPAIPTPSLLSWPGWIQHEVCHGYIPWHQSGLDVVTPPVSVVVTLSAKSWIFLECQKGKSVMDAHLSMRSESEDHCVTVENQSREVPSTQLIAIQRENVRPVKPLEKKTRRLESIDGGSVRER